MSKSMGKIMREWMESNGYGGLRNYGEDCFCEVSDMMPCGFAPHSCEPARAYPCVASRCGSVSCEGGDFCLRTEEEAERWGA